MSGYDAPGKRIETLSDIDLDLLRSNHQRVYYFGLGFIQLKINEVERLHFYSPELPVITEDIHDHRYSFTSKVLKGILKNKRWWVGIGDSHVLRYENCSPNKVSLPEEYCVAGFEATEVSEAGTPKDTYTMELDEFHQVEAVGAVTYLRRGLVEKALASIVTEKGKASVCPFSKKIPEDELWKMMARML